jgi:hypothetical protein
MAFFFKVHPLGCDALLTSLQLLLKNMLQTTCHKLQEDSVAGGFELLIWLEKHKNRMGRIF